MKFIKQLGSALYPVGSAAMSALKVPHFTPDEVKAFDVQGESDGIPNVYSGTIYGLSATHFVVGLAVGALLLPMLKAKPKRTYRRARAAATRTRSSYRRYRARK